MNTRECEKPAAETPQKRHTEPCETSPEDWARFLRARCAGCHQEPC